MHSTTLVYVVFFRVWGDSGEIVEQPAEPSKVQALTRRVVIVDGIARSGKALVAGVLARLSPFEPWQISLYVDHVGPLLRNGRIDLVSAQTMLQISLNEASFGYLIGRHLNTRASDESSITRLPNAEELLTRSQNSAYPMVGDPDVWDKVPVFLTHNQVGLENLWNGLQSQIAMFEVIRNPFTQLESWLRKDLSSRDSRHDPTMFSLPGDSFPAFGKVIQHPSQLDVESKARWFLDHLDQYVTLLNESLARSNSSQFALISLERVFDNPLDQFERVSNQLGIRFSSHELSDALASLRLPRDAWRKSVSEAQAEQREILSTASFRRLRELREELHALTLR